MKRKYRVQYGSHWIPNSAFKLDDKGMPIGEVESHVEAVQGDVIELDEARAEQFTKAFFGQPAKLALVSDSAGVPEIKTGEAPRPPTASSPVPPASPAAVRVKEAPEHSGTVGAKG